MTRRLLPFVSLLLALLAPVPAAIAQDVPYEKYVLPNGLIVILHVDHSLPVATINTWFRVGAKDELPGRSGFAHLFEHLMFMGTERVPGGNFDSIMEAGGGSNNASTSLERTNYFSSGPASLLPTLLWLDADRLEDLGRTMDQGKLDTQREVVRNEIRQQVENSPYGKSEEYLFRLMYPEGHPYHNAVYGTHEDLQAATVENVKDFFANFYVPNNASLVVAGDFDPAAIKPLIASLFGTIARGADPVHKTATPAKLDRVIRSTTLDKVQTPRVSIVYHSPAYYAEGDAEMDLAAAVLTDGKTSRLYKRLVYTDKIASEVSAVQDSSLLGSLFHINVLAQPGASLDQIEKTVDEEIARLLAEGPTKDELDQRRATMELGRLSELQRVETVADRLNQYEFYFGEPNSFKRDLDRYRNATPAGVQSWARKVLTPGARLVMRVLPEQPERSTTPRDTRPADLATAPFAPQTPATFKLANGIPVMLWRRAELPLVQMTVVLKPGRATDDSPHAGLTQLTADMLDEGTGDLNALQFGDALQSLGATFGAAADQESVDASLFALRRNFEKAARLAADAIQRPKMDPAEWKRVQSLHLEALKQEDDEPRIVASRVALRALFGDENPYGRPISGTPESVKALTIDAVRLQHTALFRPEFATILIAGDVTEADAKPVLDRLFGAWVVQGQGPAATTPEWGTPKAQALRVLIVDRPDAVQTVIRFTMPGPAYADPRRVPLHLLNTLLGGSFTSRLNNNLREQHHYAYGAGSRFVMHASAGYFSASASVETTVTGAGLKEFLAEFARLRKPGGGDINEAEATKARESLRTDVIHSMAGLRGVVSTAAELVTVGLPWDTVARDLATMPKVTAADLNRLAGPAIPLDSGVLVLVGDRKLILEQIKGMELPEPKEVTIRGEPVALPVGGK